MDSNNILLDLEIIKQIGINDKLAITLDTGKLQLHVDYSSYFSPIIRWYYGYNRNTTISYLENFSVSLDSLTKKIIEEKNTLLSLYLKKSIDESLSGFNNLKNTYQNDSIIYGKIKLIENELLNIKNILDEFNNNNNEFNNNNNEL